MPTASPIGHQLPSASVFESDKPHPVPAHAQAVSVEMPDGVLLATDVYLPPSVTGGLPTVLIRLPYDKCGRYTFLPQMAERFTAHGFAVVLQDVRGKFRSDGERDPFVHEATDGAATLDWICAQTWSDGSVGMYGDSYYGFTQWAAASTGHPALKAIVPRVTGTNFFTNCGTDAVPLLPLFEWVVHTWASPYLREEPYGVSTPAPHYYIPPEHANVQRILDALVAGATDGSLDQRLYPNGNPAAKLTIPALHVGGWFDNLLDHTLADWLRAVDSPAASHQFLRVNSVDHEDFHWREFGIPNEDHEVDDDALVRYLDRSLADPIAFLDHYLRGRNGRWPAPVVVFEVTNAMTRVADRWPPVQTQVHQLRLTGLADATSSGGRLTGLLDADQPDRPVEDESVEWVHDPTAPVPWLSPSQWAQCATLPDESPIHQRDDVLVFDSGPVAKPLDLVGPVHFSGVVDAATETTHVVARLLDLYPDGRARLIAEGAGLATAANGPAEVTVDLRATAYRIRSGHALRLALSTSLFPLYAVHPGHDGDVWDVTRLTSTKQRLLTNPAQQSRLSVTIQH